MFNFAWVDANETTFDEGTHVREDERVYSYSFEHAEGDFASLKITILNPRVGLLAAGRKVWMWFSADVGGTQTPLFFGRLVGIPQNIFQEAVELEFVARPADYVDQKLALAETMRDYPFWDELFIREDALDDPDTVLEARSALWYVDPVTHEVSVSDLLVGEDGTIEYTADDYYDGDMELSVANTPARSVEVTTAIPWNNQGAGVIDLTGLLLETWTNPVGNYWGMISSYTFMGLFNDWPQDQETYAGGYYVYQSRLENVTNTTIPPFIKKEPDIWAGVGGDFPQNLPTGSLMLTGPAYIGLFGFAPEPVPTSMIYVPLGWGKPQYKIGYAASRQYTERVSLQIGCDVQDVVTLSDEDETIHIEVPSNSASDVILGEIPIGNVGRRSFVDTDRGKLAMAHLVAIGRANLIMKARCVRLTFTTNFANGLPCSLRKNALVHNPRLPGGQMVGKIVGVAHSLDGQNGALRYQVTIAASVGKGGSYTADDGDPTYVAAGYVKKGYQKYENVIEVLSTGDIAYTVANYEPDDDKIDFTTRLGTREVVKLFTIDNLPDDQAAAVKDGASHVTPATYGVQGSTSYDEAQVRQIISDMPTKVNLQLKPLTTGPYETDVSVVVQDLVIPKQIDLEADSGVS